MFVQKVEFCILRDYLLSNKMKLSKIYVYVLISSFDMNNVLYLDYYIFPIIEKSYLSGDKSKKAPKIGKYENINKEAEQSCV